MGWIKTHLSILLCIVGCSCATTTKVEEKHLLEDALTKINCNADAVPVCSISIDDHIGYCYSSDRRQGDSISVLHERFLINYNKLSGVNFFTRNEMAFSSKGVILSCEMMSLFSKLAYERDALALHELLSVIGDSVSQHNENLYDLKSIYSENTDLSDPLIFKRVLLDVLLKMKENDKAWRRDWK